MYQSVPTTCNQPMPLTYNQRIPVLSMYQQKPTGTWPLYDVAHVCMYPVYTATHVPRTPS
jgi:hypothetical protein